jgi:two-component sensor histidine kinase
MLDPQEFFRLLNFIQEPIFIVNRSGGIEMANAAAQTLLGDRLTGQAFTRFTATPAEAVQAYLKRCAGSGSPVVGAVLLCCADGQERRFQIKGALVSVKDGHDADRIVLRCSASAFREFTQLSRQVAALNDENRKLRRARAVLEEALSKQELLLRELQHRVRNQTQMMLGMVSAARRKAVSEETTDFLDGLRRRLMALGTVQQLMYTSPSLETLSAKDLIGKLSASIAEAWPPGAVVAVDCVDAPLANDTAAPLALIVNELLSNALKHGLKYGTGTVRVEVTERENDLVLTVTDPGTASKCDEEAGASSGLALVRGLCRQIGGAFSVSNDSGTHATVRYPRPAE